MLSANGVKNWIISKKKSENTVIVSGDFHSESPDEMV